MVKVLSISNSSINLTADDLEDFGEKIEEELRGNGGGKRDRGGPSRSKTNAAIAKSNIEDAEISRRKEAEDKVVTSLEHFPKSDNPEVNQRNIDRYTDWLLKSLEFNEPHIKTEDLDYSQYKAGGPGGQNVNKVANAVLYKHTITGLFANAKVSRNTIENRNEAAAILYERLQDLIKDWKMVLNGIEKERQGEAVKTFILKSQEK